MKTPAGETKMPEPMMEPTMMATPFQSVISLLRIIFSSGTVATSHVVLSSEDDMTPRALRESITTETETPQHSPYRCPRAHAPLYSHPRSSCVIHTDNNVSVQQWFAITTMQFSIVVIKKPDCFKKAENNGKHWRANQ